MASLGVLYMIGEAIIGIASIAGNGLVLYLITYDAQLQTVTNYFIASLAIGDLLVGILGIPCVLVAYQGHPNNFMGCLILNSIIIILTQISIFGLLAIAFERFFAIRMPYMYQRYCRSDLGIPLIAIIVTWVAAILVALVPVFGWHTHDWDLNLCTFTSVIKLDYMVYFNFLGCVLLPLLIMFAIYLYIWKVVQNQMQQIISLQVLEAAVILASRKNFFLETKAAKWLAVVMAFFAVCWLPLHIMNTVTLLTSQSCTACLYAAILLSHANSAINPILYAYGNSKFRQAFHKLCCNKQTVYPSDSVTQTVPQHRNNEYIHSNNAYAITFPQS